MTYGDLRVRHDDGMVLSAHVTLHTLAVGAAEIVDDATDRAAPDEGYGLDVLVRAEKVDLPVQCVCVCVCVCV